MSDKCNYIVVIFKYSWLRLRVFFQACSILLLLICAFGFNDCLDLIVKIGGVYGVISGSRSGLTFFLSSVSFPSLFIPDWVTLVVAYWCLEAIHPGKWKCTLISGMKMLQWEEVVHFQIFCGARITPWWGCMYWCYLCWAPVVTVLGGGGGCAVLFCHTGTFHPVVTCFPVCVPTWYTSELDYFLWCIYMIPTWNWPGVRDCVSG